MSRGITGRLSFYMAALTVLLLMLSICGCSKAGTPPLDSALKTARQEGKLVMLELGSVGCIPCENMKPVMERLRQSYGGRLAVIFVDVKRDQQAANRYGVRMIPVQVFLDGQGREFYRHLGFFPYEEIVPVIEGRVK